jgi:hypothetical protein
MSSFGLISFCLLGTCVIETVSSVKYMFDAKLVDLCIVEHYVLFRWSMDFNLAMLGLFM